MINLRNLCMIGAATVALSTGAVGEQSINRSHERNELVRTTTPHGETFWRAEAKPSDDSVHIAQSYQLDGTGRAIQRSHPRQPADPPQLGGGECPYWEELVQLIPPPSGSSDSAAPLLTDSEGNVWVINTHIQSGDYELQVMQSNGHGGTWGPIDTISNTTNYVSQPQGAIDGDDNLTIVFRDISGGYHLYAIRYEPGTGWGPLTQVYSTASFFQAIEAAADADGDVLALFDPDLGPDTVWSVRRDNGSGTWKAPAQISPAGYSTLLPTLAQNRSGDSLYCVYLVDGGGPAGLYGHRWDADDNAWEPVQMLPGSESATFSLAGPVSRFPLIVGGDGEATLLWQAESGGLFTVYVSRTENGVWQAPVEVLPPSTDDTDIENFAYADANKAGDVLMAFSRFQSGANRFYAVRYRAGAGFDEVANPYTSNSIVSTRVRTSLYSGGRAIGTVLGPQDAVNQIISLRYDGLDWLPGLIDIPMPQATFFPEVLADDFETLMVYEAEQGGNQGIVATWFRASVGDLDCDGDVDLIDVASAILCGSGPGVPYDPGCEEADVDGDGDVDFADAAIMQLVFTGN